jgi:two-component system sensor histidine kinase YesM
VHRPQILVRNSLVRRFFVVFLLVVVLPVVVAGIVVTVGYRRFAQELATRRIDETLGQLAQSIEDEVRRTALLAATLSNDRAFVATVLRYASAGTPQRRYEESSLIEDRLSAFFNYTNKIGVVGLYLRDSPVFLHRNNRLLLERPLPKGSWYEQCRNPINTTIVLDDLDSYSLSPQQPPLLKVAVCPSLAAYREGFEAMVVAFWEPSLAAVASPGSEMGGEELILADREGRIILASNPERVGGTLDPDLLAPRVLRRGRDTVLSASAAIPSASWLLVGLSNYSHVARDVETLVRVARITLVALILLFSLYIEFFFLQVIRPIRSVIEEMRRVEQGHWEASVKEGGAEELASLARGFNSMVQEIHLLTEQRKQEERERARLELEALQHQINPHFLTNTLNSIKLMAAMSHAEPIRRMTAALMRVVSESFRQGGRLAPLGEEIDTLEQYIHIMRMRYGDSFTVVYALEPHVQELYVLRMLLQPLVENAILHGVSGLQRRGEIRISARRQAEEGGEVLLLAVHDDGRGMDEERLRTALSGSSGHHRGLTSIGLHNVAHRIVLNHGDGFGLRLESEPGSHTTVELRLPVLTAPIEGE